MLNAILAAFGVAMITGGEALAFLGGLDALLFWGEADLMRIGGLVALALSVVIGGWVFRHILRCERTLLAGT